MTEQSQYNRATITPADLTGSMYGRMGEASALMARAYGWVYKAASINAAACARVPLRLYRHAKSTGKRIGPDRKSIILNPAIVGRKAARYAESAEDVEEVADHPVLDLLQTANAHDNGYELIELAYFCQELTGNAYLWVNRAGAGARGEPMELWTMYPQWTRIIPSRESFVAGYAYGRQRGDEVAFEADEVIHFRHRMDPTSPLYGMSWLRAALIDADIMVAARQSELAMFENSARPDYAYTTKEAITNDQVKQIDEALNRKFRGPDKRGKIAVLSGEASIVPLGFSPREMEYIAGQEWTRDVIMALADIPKSIYTSDDVNLANANVGERMHARLAVLPRVQRLTDTLTARLLPMYGVADGEMWFACDDPTPDDQALRRDTNVAYVGAGVLTINEARAEEGYDPIDGGDEPRIAGQPIEGPFRIVVNPNTPDGGAGETDANTPPPAPATAPNASAAEVVSLVESVAAGRVPADSAVEVMVSLMGFAPDAAWRIIAPAEAKESEELEPTPKPEPADEPEPEPGEKCGCPADSKQSDFYGVKNALANDSDFREHASNEFATALETYFKRQANAIAKAAREADNPAGLTLARVPVPKSIKQAGQWDEELLSILRKFAADPARLGMADGARMLLEAGAAAPAETFTLDTPEVVEFLQTYHVNLARTSAAINRTTEDAVASIVADGIENSLTPRQIGQAISDGLAGVSRDRGVTIARTEHARAYGMGRQAQWSASGVVSGKRWAPSVDACEFCRAVAARGPVALNAPFVPLGETLTGTAGSTRAIDYADVLSEPLHPNCKCATVAVLIQGGETPLLRGEEGP